MKDYFQSRAPGLNINNNLPVARPGLVFILVPAVLALLTLTLGWCTLTTLFALAAAFSAWFFRDPDRPTPPSGFGLSPADGRVIKVESLPDNPYLSGPTVKISIFMSPFNVHVNRAPLDGRLVSQTYFPGAFLKASLDKASTLNERNALVLETEEGPVAVVQIAGLIARRIVTWV
jgi:phosphatidylserine decarboxylase